MQSSSGWVGCNLEVGLSRERRDAFSKNRMEDELKKMVKMAHLPPLRKSLAADIVSASVGKKPPLEVIF